MRQDNNQIFEGTILETLPNTLFRIELADGRQVLASVAGRMRRSFLRILPGDKVRVEMTPYDNERGRIIFRYR